MARYTAEQERRAQDRLAQIWRASTRREKLRIAERFDYRGSDESKLRVMRRLLTGRIPKGHYVVVTEYFEDFVTQEQRDALKIIPTWSLSEPYFIVSNVMYVAEINGVLESWENALNPKRDRDENNEIIETSPRVDSTSVRYLFELYADTVRDKLRQAPGKSGRIEAIAFSDKGTRLVSRDFKVPIPQGVYGIAINPTHHIYVEEIVDGKEKMVSQPFPEARIKYQRRFPASKSKEMTAYANRAYGQMVRPGGRLS